jgi:HK97 gp10 family phage protein
MADQARVEVIGDRELAAKLAALSDAAAGAKLEAAVRAGALLVQNAAKEKAPYRTGTLRRSIHTEIIEQRRNYAEATVGTDLVYAAQVEFGGTITPKKAKMLHWVDRETGQDVFAHAVTQVARPYLRPAFDENADAAVQEMGDALREAVEGVTG